MDNKKRFVLNLSAQILSFCVNLGINFFLSSYIVNEIGKEVYGFVGLANNFVSYVQIFTVAFNAMLSRFVTVKLIERDYAHANTYISSVTICNIVISIVLLIPSVLLCCFLEYVIEVPQAYSVDIKVLWFLIFGAFMIQLSTNTFQTCFFSTNRLDLSAKRSLENNFLRACLLIICFTFFEPHVWFLGMVSLICAVYLAIVNRYYMRKLTPILSIKRTYFSFSAMRELVEVGIWNSVNQLSQLLMTGFDLLITNIFIGASEMGMLSIAKIVPTQLLAFVGMVSNIFIPRMTILYAERDRKVFLKETFFSMRVCGALCSVPIIGFIVFGQPFFGLWMESLLPEEIISVQILSILTLLPTVFSVYVYPLYSVNTITCKLKVPVLLSVSIGIVNLGVVYFLLENTNLGIYAVAGVSSILLLFRVILFVPMYAAHNLGENLFTFYPSLIRGVIANISMFLMFRTVMTITVVNDWIELICVAIICGMIGYIMNFFIVFSSSERQKVLNILSKKFGKKLRNREK